jgi:hypothetical protein
LLKNSPGIITISIGKFLCWLDDEKYSTMQRPTKELKGLQDSYVSHKISVQQKPSIKG